MADKRISQLIERTDIANNDVLPIVASGATTTNKVTISTIQDWMQENLDVGVTSVGITLGTSGTDVNVTGSPITTSGNITINIPDASASARGVVTTGSQVFGGVKTFANGLSLSAVGGSNQVTRVVNIGTLHEGTASLNQIGFNSGNNIYFGKGLSNGGVISWNNAAVRYYTLPDADGTIALTSQLDGYVTLNTAQTITAQKTFTTSGSSDTMIISHGSGSGIALDVIKAGNSEAIRVTKTSGSGNAVTISGGLLSAEAGTFTGDLTSNGELRVSNNAGLTFLQLVNSSAGGRNFTLISSGASNPHGIAAGNFYLRNSSTGTNPLLIDGSTGAVTLTGALNGTSANFVGSGSTNLIVERTGSNGSFMQLKDASGNSVFLGARNGDFEVQTPSGGFSNKLVISNSGAATFSSSVTINGTGNPALDVQGTAIIRGNGSAYATHYFTTSAANVAQYDQYDASGNIKNRLRADGNSYITGGNVGIGTASPQSWTRLEVAGTAGAQTDAAQQVTIAAPTTTVGHGAGLRFNAASGAKEAVGIVGIVNEASGNLGAMTFHTYGGGANIPERMRITSVGFLKASNNGVYESATGSYHELNSNSNGGGTVIATHRGTNPYGIESHFSDADPNNASNYMFAAYTTSGSFAWIYRIFSNGTVSARSDARWKKNIETARNGYIDDLCKLRVVKYNWYNHEDDAPKELGLIAQEVEEVFPGLVQQDPVIAKREVEQEDGTFIEEEFEDGVSRSIKTSVLPFMLIKAMQEQQEQIKSLTEQIEALKSQING